MVPAAQQLFLDHALPVLARTPGLVGVAVGGSWLENSLDQYSDLDLVLVLDPAQAPRLMEERPLLAASLGQLLECFTGEHVGEPRLLICLYDEPLLHVDLKFVALPDLAQRVEDPSILWQQDTLVSGVLQASRAQPPPAPSLQWLEDRFWIWVHYAATKLGRGELLEVVSFLDYLRTTVLGPLLTQQHGGLPVRGVRKLEQMLPTSALASLHATVATAERTSCVHALEQAIATYRSLRHTLRTPEFVAKQQVERRAVTYLADVASGA
ncbi:oxalate:formate antiporter [Hymenobacter cellulosivorans]|uniref:Oxalate:formate antiporter n=1 Tax=Hymenobacter cellulosivorans TaxID=2932249 RepID=A0ABY4F9G0_9BACT|nr:oxalate:formate antiporter [Hymenobacter cellulosivorans]UOQ52767.1 oxalate:formate antiporter [Hymenobacter cellulosivorans]